MATDVEMQHAPQHKPSETYISEPFDVPSGLRFLLKTTQLRVYRMKIEGQSKFCAGFPRKFVVADQDGRPILEGSENSSWCSRTCCEGCHSFEIDFHDADGTTVLSMERSAGCAPCFCAMNPSMTVASGRVPYGTVHQTGCLPFMRLTLSDPSQHPYLQFLGPSLRQSPFVDGIFKLKCPNVRGSLGRLTVQQFDGMDTYHIFFPSDLDLRMKTLTIASAVLLDCIFA